MEKGEQFNVVFTKEQQRTSPIGDEIQEFMVVARVSDSIRKAIKTSSDRIFLDCSSHHVTDRFYVKCCMNCHKFGHYQTDRSEAPSCGYCWSTDHQSIECPVQKDKDKTKYKCINCHEVGKKHDGHSSHWPSALHTSSYKTN